MVSFIPASDFAHWLITFIIIYFILLNLEFSEMTLGIMQIKKGGGREKRLKRKGHICLDKINQSFMREKEKGREKRKKIKLARCQTRQTPGLGAKPSF